MAGGALQWRRVGPCWILSSAHRDLLPATPAIFMGQLLVFPFPTRLSWLCSGHLQRVCKLITSTSVSLSVHRVSEMLITWKPRGIFGIGLDSHTISLFVYI